jgi:hypothetical protein
MVNVSCPLTAAFRAIEGAIAVQGISMSEFRKLDLGLWALEVERCARAKGVHVGTTRSKHPGNEHDA